MSSHVSLGGYGSYEQKVRALERYTATIKEHAEAGTLKDVDWITRKVLYDEYLFEEVNATDLVADAKSPHGRYMWGSMSTHIRQNKTLFQGLHSWMVSYDMADIHKHWHLSFTEYMLLPYPVMNMLLHRSRRKIAAIEKARADLEEREKKQAAEGKVSPRRPAPTPQPTLDEGAEELLRDIDLSELD